MRACVRLHHQSTKRGWLAWIGRRWFFSQGGAGNFGYCYIPHHHFVRLLLSHLSYFEETTIIIPSWVTNDVEGKSDDEKETYNLHLLLFPGVTSKRVKIIILALKVSCLLTDSFHSCELASLGERDFRLFKTFRCQRHHLA